MGKELKERIPKGTTNLTEQRKIIYSCVRITMISFVYMKPQQFINIATEYFLLKDEPSAGDFGNFYW